MIRRHGSALRALLMVADGAVAAIVLVVVFNAYYSLPGRGVHPNLDLIPWWAPTFAYAFAWVTMLYLEGQYRLRAQWSWRTEAVGIGRATIWLAVVSYAAVFLFEMDDVARVYTMILFPVQFAVTLGTRAALRATFMFARRRGRNRRNVLVVGTGELAVDFARRLEDHSVLGLVVIGMLGDEPDESTTRWPYLGQIEAFDRVMRTNVVDEVAICLPASETPMVEAIARICQEEGKLVRIPLDVPKVETGRRFVEDLDGTAVLSFVRGPDQLLGLATKRLIDVVVAGLGLLILSPFVLAIALVIWRRDGRPILFRQQRVGEHGRLFTLYKFRTMAPDAEERYAEMLERNRIRGPAFKVTDDPRVTRTGRFLRRTSLDELPQLWNVLRGQMSLVGPRPAPPREVAGYDLWHRRRLSMKPGITGLWQVSARSSDDFDERASLDMAYIDGWSLWLDLRIVARTLPEVLGFRGQ